MMLEMAAIGERLGLKLRVDVDRRIDGAAALGPHKMSMLQDLERGQPMEIEPLVGVVQELGPAARPCRRRPSISSSRCCGSARAARYAHETAADRGRQ